MQQWQVVALRRYIDFLAQDMAEAATSDGLDANNGVDWVSLASLFLHAVGGWCRTESLTRTVTKQEAAAYCSAVIDAIFATIAAKASRQA